MSDFDLDFGVRVSGADTAIRDVGRVAHANERAAQTTQQAARTSTQAISGLGQSVQQVGQRTGQTVGALGQMATQLGQLAPGAGQAGAAISQLGGSIGALSGAMGPLGVGLAAVTAAVGLLGAGFRAQQSAMDASRESARALTQDYDQLAAAAQRAINAQQTQQRLARGEGSLAEQQGFTQGAVNQQELRLRALRGDVGAQEELRRMGVISSGGEPGTLDRAGGLLTDLLSGQAAGTTRVGGTLSPEDIRRLEEDSSRFGQMALERQRLEAGAAVEETAGRVRTTVGGARRRGGGGRSSAAGGENTTDNAAVLEAEAMRQSREVMVELQKAYDEHLAARDALAEASARQAEQDRDAADAQRELAETAQQASDVFRDSWRGSIDDVVDAWRDANRALRASGGQMLTQADLLRVGMTSVGNQIADTIGGTMVGAFEQALGAWLDGSKSFVEAAEDMVKGVLKALVIESIVQAVTETARGIADIASYRYDSGALHFAAAAAWAAVGGVAGAVGAGIGAFGGGGGGGDKASAASAATPTDASAQAQPSQPTVINVYPGGYITARDVQAGIVDALNSAAREGRRVDPSIVGA